MLLNDVMPWLVIELKMLLVEANEFGLAEQVPSLMIADRCNCGGEFCAMFYTATTPSGPYGPGHRNVALNPDSGTLILDVVDEQIRAVEVLDRDEVREVLSQLALPPDNHKPRK
jgi:hypothetical protein